MYFYLQHDHDCYYARAPHCPQNGPWTGAPQALQKLRGGAGGGISQLRSGAAAGISSADGADGKCYGPYSGYNNCYYYYHDDDDDNDDYRNDHYYY